MASTVLLLFHPEALTPAQLAAVSYLARYTGHTRALYAYQFRRWFSWCDTNTLAPFFGIQRAHLELYIRHLHNDDLRDSSINTMLHGVRGFSRFAHIDGLIAADPAVYARLPKIHADATRTQGLDRLELIRFLQIAQTLTVHHGALAFLLGINALRASEAAAVQIGDYAEALRGYRALHLVGKGSKPATMPPTVPVVRVLEACRGQRTEGPLVLRPTSRSPSTAATCTAWSGGSRKPPVSRGTSAHPPCDPQPSPTPSTPASLSARHKSSLATLTHAPQHYDRARDNLDRHGVHSLTAYVAGV